MDSHICPECHCYKNPSEEICKMCVEEKREEIECGCGEVIPEGSIYCKNCSVNVFGKEPGEQLFKVLTRNK